MLKKTLCCLLCCIAILCLTATSVLASETEAPQEQTGVLILDYSKQEPPVTGGFVELRQVAVWDPETETMSWCEAYRGLELPIETLEQRAKTAQVLAAYARSKEIPAQRIPIDGEGKAEAEGLEPGVWMVTQTEPFAGYYCVSPTLVPIPMELNGGWTYKVTALPKLEPVPVDTTEPTVPTTTEPEEELPPTGQVNWPVPVLAVVGCFLILLGLCLRKGRREG